MASHSPFSDDTQNNPGGPNGADTGPAAGMISQYVKDLSVENPNAPHSYQWQDQPQVDIQVNIASNRINEEVFEVELKITANAKCEQGALYLVDLSYCGLVGLRNVPDEASHMFQYAETPRMLFPFARAVIAEATRDAGYPPLVLDPMDFGQLYQQQLAARAQQQQLDGDQPPAGNA
ncbi:protein-export chaperone SecB [Qipengyuania sp.]|uniref:protein-export chaperone SecB n=1 Tax=Qipengyuania sp. TaxID=2004515 RepID=UPI003735F12E